MKTAEIFLKTNITIKLENPYYLYRLIISSLYCSDLAHSSKGILTPKKKFLILTPKKFISFFKKIKLNKLRGKREFFALLILFDLTVI